MEENVHGREGFSLSIAAAVLLAVAVSLDGLGAGLACGAGRVRIPLPSVLLMGAAAGGAVFVSMSAGALAGNLFSAALTRRLGGGLLIFFGLWLLGEAGREDKGGLLGMLRDPARADADRSGSISMGEAAVLGLALALDGFGAGFGAAMAGYSPLVTGLLVALVKVAFVSLGQRAGRRLTAFALTRHLQVLPGLIILALGLMKFILL